MWLATNVEGMGAFDDVIFFLEYQNGQREVYIMQLKHTTALIEAASFARRSDDFSISKYQKSFEKILDNDNNILENINLDSMTFIIYTTSDLTKNIDKNVMNSLNLELYEKTLCKYKRLLLTTSPLNAKCIYELRKEDKTKGGFNENFLSHFLIFVNQGKTDTIEDLVQKLLSEAFGNPNKNIMLNFLNFMKKWERGSFGKQYKLRKREVQLKLLELLLDPYLVEPRVFSKFGNAHLWNNIVNSADITIVSDFDEEVVPRIWTAVNVNLYRYCDLKLKQDTPWESRIGLTINSLPKKFKTLTAVVATLEQLNKNKEYTLKYLYVLLWKVGLLPLLLIAETIKDIQNIATALKLSNNEIIRRHYICFFKSEGIDLANIFKGYSLIQSFSDIQDKNLVKKLLENMKVSLQERQPVELSQLVDESENNIFSIISTAMVLKMLHQPLVIGTKLGDLPRPYIKRSIRIVCLRKEVLQLSRNVFVVIGSKNIVNILKVLTDQWRVVDGKNYCEKYFSVLSNDQQNVIGLPESCASEVKKINFASNQYGIHYLRCYKSKLEWLHSTGNVDSIKPYIIDLEIPSNHISFREELFLKYFNGNVNLISSVPGMGKSVLMKRLAQRCMVDYWSIIINLTNYESYLEKTRTFSLNEIANFHIKQNWKTPYENFANCLITILMKKKKVLFLLDAFDELPLEINESVVKLAKLIKNDGFRLWITTRPNHSSYLEKELDTLSLSLCGFTEYEQEIFFINYFDKLERRNTEGFVKQLLLLTKRLFGKWNTEFLSVPLHLDMISEVVKYKSIQETEKLEHSDLIGLYEIFLNRKFEVYLKKSLGDCNISNLNKIFQREMNYFKTIHAKASLLLFFPRELLEKIFSYTDVYEFLKDSSTGEENFGIIASVSNVNNSPVFVHRSFAEYLAANFLAMNCKDRQFKPLLEGLFERQLSIVRLLFDKILAKNRPLHLCVLNNEYEELKELLNKRSENSETDLDVAGRTPFHIAASWGIRYSFPHTNLYKQDIFTSKSTVNTFDPSTDRFGLQVDVEIFKILHSVNEFSNKLDCLFGWYPTDYTIRSCSINFLDIFVGNNEAMDFLKFLGSVDYLVFYCVKYGYLNILQNVPLDTYIITKNTKNLLHLAIKNENYSSRILTIVLEKGDPSINKLYLEKAAGKYGTPLMFAALSGNIEAFKILLKYAVDINKTYFTGLNILHISAFYSNFPCLKELLTRNDVDLNIRAAAHSAKDYAFKNPGHTALYFAVNNNNLAIVKLLIEKGGDINLTYENQRTVLHVAAVNEYTDCIIELRDNGADLNSLDENNRTPLHYAVFNAKLHSINCLLELGADINVTDIYGKTPIHYAVQNLKIDQVNFPGSSMLDDFNRKDNDGKTLLHLAIHQKKVKIKGIRYLLQHDNPNNWHRYATTLHYLATLKEKLDNIKFLIQKGVNPNTGDDDGRTVLHYVTMQNCLESMEYILGLGADINKQDKYGETPLFCATKMGKLTAIKLLLQFDADINKSDAFKVTPLHVATEKGFNECASELINSGANVNLSSVDGCTPLFIAVKKGNEELVQLLIANKANVNKSSYDISIKNGFHCIRRKNVAGVENFLSPLHVGIQCRNLKIITYILQSKVKINQTDNYNWTALHLAADSGYIECIPHLLKKGAGLHLQTKDGFTPIHLATNRNMRETLKALLNESNCIKALNKLDNNLQTALHSACFLGHLDCVKILVAKGADLDLRTNEGDTPIDLAINQGHQDVKSFLLAEARIHD